jgi:SAM-dependent methyltransferase
MSQERLQSCSFTSSAALYDSIYEFKNYAQEAARLSSLIDQLTPDARTILDVACGTGEHAQFLKAHFVIDGIDINEDYLRAARLKNTAGKYVRADMFDFDLGRTYDVVTCLFSAIGIAGTFERLERAISRMAYHVKPGGTLIVEPWFTPDQWRANPMILEGALAEGRVYRFSIGSREGPLSALLYNYLCCTSAGIEYYNELIELGLFTRDEMVWAFESAGIQPSYDPAGLMGRGLYVGTKSCVMR